MLFTKSKVSFLAKVIAFLNLENTGNMRANFNCDLPKMGILGFKIYLLLNLFSNLS